MSVSGTDRCAKSSAYCGLALVNPSIQNVQSKLKKKNAWHPIFVELVSAYSLPNYISHRERIFE